jgi:tetraacyldisaccharide 4'-kinase
MPQAPEFWAKAGMASDLLLPLAWINASLGAARWAVIRPKQVGVPVICVGNLVAGGAGKTPVVLSLVRLLREAGQRPHVLSRGYGGSLKGPLRVDPAQHSEAQVGDEALLLAQAAPTWIGRDRVASAEAAIAAGASVLLLDDGFQNPALHYDRAFLVIDGTYGLGNGRVMPSGPLREPAALGLARADAVIVMGENRAGLRVGGVPLFGANLVARDADHLRGRKLVAFAGIGRPEKFFETLDALGAALLARRGFPDHHRYRDAELESLCLEAAQHGAMLITTEKDLVRLAPRWRAQAVALKVDVAWQDEAALKHLLGPVAAGRDG